MSATVREVRETIVFEAFIIYHKSEHKTSTRKKKIIKTRLRSSNERAMWRNLLRASRVSLFVFFRPTLCDTRHLISHGFPSYKQSGHKNTFRFSSASGFNRFMGAFPPTLMSISIILHSECDPKRS